MGKKKLIKCPNCGAEHFEDDFNPSFRYVTLIECPDCIKRVKPENRAQISDVPDMFNR